ncbi:MAG: DUF1080 domain-containing protein [Gemmatimonadaceae bacterium]|nr:DUF1080 domain-containing protein [Gemmatimonadaceae bacterium]
MTRRLLSLVAAALLLPTVVSAQAAPLNTLTTAEQKAGWRLLFDGKSMDAWRGYQQETMPPEWSIVDGALTKIKNTNDIVTREQFGDFDLTLEWKVALRGNSGIFYRATERETKVYWSAPEYQLAEDSLTPDSRNIMTSVAAVYGFYPSKRGVVKPAGEWNTTRILAKGPHVEHWLNGVLIAQYEMWSKEWTEKLRGVPGDSTKKPLKFAPYADWGMAKRGHLAIQGDHNGALSLRNIKIRELK